MYSKNDVLFQQKYSVEIDCLSFQLNYLLNIFLNDNVCYILLFQQKYFIMIIQQEIKQVTMF